jgi:hypothetical protein
MTLATRFFCTTACGQSLSVREAMNTREPISVREPIEFLGSYASTPMLGVPQIIGLSGPP